MKKVACHLRPQVLSKAALTKRHSQLLAKRPMSKKDVAEAEAILRELNKRKSMTPDDWLLMLPKG